MGGQLSDRVAATSPKTGAGLVSASSGAADGGKRAYNWALVMRHELTHAFNLLQTTHRVPIWLTEGLAVRSENTNRFAQVMPVLRSYSTRVVHIGDRVGAAQVMKVINNLLSFAAASTRVQASTAPAPQVPVVSATS